MRGAGDAERADDSALADAQRAGRGAAVRSIGYVPAFDGLRAVAVILVVVLHLGVLAPVFNNTLVSGGFLGVDIFFVLSGFLITSLLLRDRAQTGRVHLGSFYAGRALRLLPALVAFLVAQAFWAAATGVPAHDEVPAVASAMFYVSIWRHAPDVGGLAHLWSLQVEEQFYLLWPLLVVVFLSLIRRREVMLIVTIVLVVAISLYRAVYVATASNQALAMLIAYTHPQYRSDGLLMGALAAQLWTNGWWPRRGLKVAAWIGGAFVIGAALWVQVISVWLYYGGYTLIAVAAGFVVLAVVETEWTAKRFLSLRGLRAIGVVSYGIYLWHFLVFVAVAQAGPDWSSWVRLSVGLSVTALVVWASWVLVERPFLRLKDRLRSRRPSHEIEAAAAD